MYAQNFRTAERLFWAVRMRETSSGVRMSLGTINVANEVTCSDANTDTGAVLGSIPSCCSIWRKNLSSPCR